MSLRDKIQAASARRFTTVTVPLLGDVRLRSLTAREMRALKSSLSDSKGEFNKERAQKLDLLLIALCVVDAAGNLEFSEADVAGGLLDDIDGGALTVLFSACKSHTGFGADEDWQAIEDAAKN